ncbi:hypothetical protein K3181_11085 [Qipengyuania sp. YG27]|uniref:Uncharacterized protein n=1 Tax=Qipengyuania mesophila TaxID=2867246 RepID=A0ABS7JWF9_9SPHN|nr:hypothetical protein [Qipengyuania mesophila]MBX7501986.1 hypothetical protein [Qipengyuania mesophila]
MNGESTFFLLATLLFLALLVLGFRTIEVSEKRARYAQALLTLVALATTGYWFFLERKGMPHADVSQEVSAVPLGDGLIAVEAHVKVHNLGQRELVVDHLKSRLQLVRGDAYRYDLLNAKKGDDYWAAKRSGKSHKPQFNQAELLWPIHRTFDRRVEYKIEPGETDLVVATFLMSCSKANWIRVATDIFKPSGAGRWFGWKNEKDKDKAWKARTFLDVRSACDQEENHDE